jgi:hypothetical protein
MKEEGGRINKEEKPGLCLDSSFILPPSSFSKGGLVSPTDTP